MTERDTTSSPLLSFHTHNSTHTRTHTYTTIDMHPCACYAINPLPLNSYPSMKCETCFACQSLQLILVTPVLSRRTGGRDEEGEERGGCRREVTEESDTKRPPPVCSAQRRSEASVTQ